MQLLGVIDKVIRKNESIKRVFLLKAKKSSP